MIIRFANGYVLSRDFEDGLARIRATEIGQRSRPKITDRRIVEKAFATGQRFGDATKPILVLPSGPSGYETGVWLTEAQAYAVITESRAGAGDGDVLLRQVIRAFVDQRAARLTSVLGEPVTPTFSPKDSAGEYWLSEFESLYIFCLATDAELPPNKSRSAALADIVELFDERRRTRRPKKGPLYLV